MQKKYYFWKKKGVERKIKVIRMVSRSKILSNLNFIFLFLVYVSVWCDVIHFFFRFPCMFLWQFSIALVLHSTLAFSSRKCNLHCEWRSKTQTQINYKTSVQTQYRYRYSAYTLAHTSRHYFHLGYAKTLKIKIECVVDNFSCKPLQM